MDHPHPLSRPVGPVPFQWSVCKFFKARNYYLLTLQSPPDFSSCFVETFLPAETL
ncbi:hypothetical protein YC2023_053863 [Brassica napus]